MWIINNYKKAKKAKVRSYVRGYNILKKRDNLSYISNIKEKLSKITENGENFDILNSNPEDICLQQFLVQRLLGLDFNKQLLSAIAHKSKTFHYPLPLEWRKVLEKEGLNSISTKNIVLWEIFKLRCLFSGIYRGFSELTNFFKPENLIKDNYVYFVDLKVNNVQRNKNKYSSNILEWFSIQKEANDVYSIAHSVKGLSIEYYKNKKFVYNKLIPKINSVSNFINFSFWFLTNILLCFFYHERKIIFKELVYAKLFNLASNYKFPKKYFFHNSSHILRPLWTYEAEKLGAEIVFYFYSTNVVSFKLKGKTQIQDSIWGIVNWPLFWVWNDNQMLFLKKFLSVNSRFSIRGTIPFSSPKQIFKLEISGKDKILVFDVQPFKSYIYKLHGHTIDYYNEINSIEFLLHIDKVAKEFDLDVYIKRKRFSNDVSKKYMNQFNKLISNNYWFELPSDYDAHFACHLVKPNVSISSPFTSTGIISSSLKIPTAYYDNTENLDGQFFTKQEYPLISGYKYLCLWIDNNLNHNSTLNNIS